MSLHPHGFEHLILDGVVHGEKAYRVRDVKPSSVRDAENNFGVSFDSCAKAGPEGCPFFAIFADLVRTRYNALEAKLIKYPIPVKGFPDGFGYTALHRLLSLAVTDSNDIFPFLASVFVEAESGVAGDLINLLIAGYPLSPVVNDNGDGSFELPPQFIALTLIPTTSIMPKTSYRTLGACCGNRNLLVFRSHHASSIVQVGLSSSVLNPSYFLSAVADGVINAGRFEPQRTSRAIAR